MGSALYLARLMQVFLGQPRVTLADYFKFTDQTFMGWVGYDRKPKVPYYVIPLFARHFGTRLVQASIESPAFDVSALGIMPAETGVAEPTAVASLDASGRTLFVNIINRSWDTVHPVRFDLGAFAASPRAVAWTLGSPGVTDHNGRDLPPGTSASLYDEPAVSPDAKLPIGIVRRSVDLTRPWPIPPHSIVTIEFSAAPAGPTPAGAAN